MIGLSTLMNYKNIWILNLLYYIHYQRNLNYDELVALTTGSCLQGILLRISRSMMKIRLFTTASSRVNPSKKGSTISDVTTNLKILKQNYYLKREKYKMIIIKANETNIIYILYVYIVINYCNEIGKKITCKLISFY
jgi:hypothetical protein